MLDSQKYVLVGNKPLTNREIEALKAIAINGHIANAATSLNISETMLRIRLNIIREKIGVDTTIQAVYIVAKRGLI